MWTTAVYVGWLAAGEASAREYPLDPVASGISLDDRIRIVPQWIEVSKADYVILINVQNNGQEPVIIHSSGLVCVRGAFEGKATYGASFGIGERNLDLAAGEIKPLKLLCDHGPITGEFGLKIPVIYANPGGDGASIGEPVFQNVVWRLAEADLAKERQKGGKRLATGSYDRPESAAPAAPAVPAPAEAPPPPPATIVAQPG